MTGKTTTVSLWGNSLGLRLPKEAARALGLSAGASVSLSLEGKTLTVTAAAAKTPSLVELLAEMRRLKSPKQEEVDWGAPRSNEVW